jgi:hypothetical protein
MMAGAVAARRALAAAAGLLVSLQVAAACSGPAEVREARPLAVKAYVLGTGKAVLSFAGNSGAEYEDPTPMLSHAERALAARQPADTLVNIGATAVGIGAVYELAKRMGFTTIGIVSTQARDEKLALQRAGRPVTFIPADMNHRIASDKARKASRPEPTDFQGSAHKALMPGR